jgi:hypothetical protein
MRCEQTSARFACCVLMQIKPASLPYRVKRYPHGTGWQIFICDSNNVEIELNFETKNEVAA